ncbi:MAG TPA: nitroreductase family protein [candidate division Zixibacteria bacterium]|nr:nitroreductase family protein [candidate division Zixibacteria bacterium]
MLHSPGMLDRAGAVGGHCCDRRQMFNLTTEQSQTLEEFLNSHRSVRSFTDEEIPESIVARIIRMARRAPTSSNLQLCSILTVRARATKGRLAELCGHQQHVSDSPVFFVFLADLYPLSQVCTERGYPFKGDYLEPFLLATVDAALCAGRALTGAQALGYGGVLVGGIRNDAAAVAELLGLPRYCYPVCGMSLGRPAKIGARRPRIADDGLRHREHYDPDAFRQAFAEYDRSIRELGWYAKRRVPLPEGVAESATPDEEYSWLEHSARRISSDAPSTLRQSLRPFLEKIGFRLK